MHTQFQLGYYIHECRNETQSLTNMQNIISTWLVFLAYTYVIIPAKVDYKSCSFARECVSFVPAWMELPQMEIVFAWTDTNGSQCCLYSG